MSLADVDEFLKKIASDPELAKRVKTAAQGVSLPDLPSTISAISGKEGFDVTSLDLRQKFDAPLSEAELGLIAGGANVPFSITQSFAATATANLSSIPGFLPSTVPIFFQQNSAEMAVAESIANAMKIRPWTAENVGDGEP